MDCILKRQNLDDYFFELKQNVQNRAAHTKQPLSQEHSISVQSLLSSDLRMP